MLTFDREFEVREENRRGGSMSSPFERDTSSYGLSDVLNLLRRHAKFIVAVIAVGTLLAAVITYSLTKIYTASSTLVFDRNDTRPYESVLELQKLERDKSAMETEMDLVRSREFLGFVVDDLKLQEDPYFNPKLAIAHAETEGSWWSRWLDGSSGSKGARGREDFRAITVADGRQRDRAITRLAAAVSADRKGDSLAMTIFVKHPIPAQAAEIANGVASNYVEWSSKLKEAAAKNTVNYLRSQANALTDSIARKEREVADFTARSDLTFDPRDDVLRARVDQLNEQFTLARVEEAGAWAKFNEAKQLLASSVDAAGRVLTSDLLSNLRSEEGTLVRTRAQLTAKYGRNHPLVLDADAEIASNQRLIDAEVQRVVQELANEAKIATVRVKKFQQEVGLLQKQMQDRNLDEIRRRELERDLLAEQKRYDEIVLRLGSFDPEQEEVKATARIVSFAELPGEPSFPKPALIMPASVIASLLLAVMGAIAFDALDDRIKTPRQVEEATRRPNLLSIPDVTDILQSGEGPYQHMLANPHSPFARSMRSLSLSWRAMDLGADKKLVMFCSAKAGEGKTTCALGMAAVATLSGLRAIILDIDPKASGAAAILGVPTKHPARGTSLDGTLDLESAIAVAAEYPFLRILNARLGLHNHEELFEELRRRFDLIIVDAPGLDRDDDAIWLSPHMDAVLLVVAAGRTGRRALEDAVERLGVSRAPIVGNIVNFSSGLSEVSPISRLQAIRTGAREKLKSLTTGRRFG
ncbi:GumC family protein [Sinorhizobium chiapasense]|uniref:Polysaccharide biosynthesis tyrosine autokinase n=1 Tax=Sinorhizobium chiapasense TaxID=501572 RepID=A0ABZ2BK80_9HYPH